MYRKYFFKNKGVLSRKFVASGLAAVFSAGMFGSYAGAMENELNNAFENIKIEDEFKGKDKEEITKFVNGKLLEKETVKENLSKNGFVLENEYVISLITAIGEDKGKLKNFFIKMVSFFYEILNLQLDLKYKSFKEFCEGYIKQMDLGNMFSFLMANSEGLKKLDSLINSFSNKKENIENINEIIFGIVIVLVVIIAITFAVRGNFNTGVPNNNKDDEKVKPPIDPENPLNDSESDDEKVNPSIEPEKDKDDEKVNPSIEPEKDKDDEKVNPSIEPEKDKDDEKMNPSTNPESNDEKVKPPIDPSEPSTDPESDEQNPEQKKQEQGSQEQKSSIGPEILKGAGTAAAGGTLSGGGTYLVNEVLKSVKPSEVKNQKNVNGKHMSLDSDGNEVTKTEEGEEIHNSDGTKNKGIGDSDAKQYLEDKDVEKTEEEQEEILESSALSDDTEATGDENKNKD